MNFFKKIYCRSYQGIVRCIMPFLPYHKAKPLTDYEKIPQLLRSKNIYSVMIITMKSAQEKGLLDDLLEVLELNNIRYYIYDKTIPNPTEELVEDAKLIFLLNKYRGIIALGGGSAMDLAKAVAARAANPKLPLSKMMGLLHIKNELPFLIAIPTTAGSGSETTMTAVITNPKLNDKYTINDFKLIPDYCLLDYKLTFGLPKELTAQTGMDALTHAIEAYLGHSRTKDTIRKSEFAVELIVKNIKNAYDKPYNTVARLNMLYSAYYAGISFTRSYVGYVHAIAHSLGGMYNLPHGLLNAIILPIVLEKYGKKIYKRLAILARKAELAKEDDSDMDASLAFINWIKEINSYMKIPTSIASLKKEDIDILVTHADKEANPLYPVPVLFDKKELEEIYYQLMPKE